MVDGAALLHLVGDQRVALVEEEDAELLDRLEAHRAAAVVDHRRPRIEERALLDRLLQETLRRGVDHLDVMGRLLADAVDLGQARHRRGQHLAEAAEFPEQLLGDRLGVDPRDRLEQEQLEQLVVAEVLPADLVEALAQPLAVVVVVGDVPGLVVEARHAPLRGGVRPFGESVKIS